jgi:DNA-binding GntR family transcriptional regulator
MPVKQSPIIGSSLRGDVSDMTYRTLRESILNGTLGGGQRLVELALCDWLKVSRTPAREALRRLHSDGLVEPAIGGGLQVVTYDLNALHELYAVREVLEAKAAAEAARNATPFERLELEESVRQQQANTGDVKWFVEENQRFHEKLSYAAHNRFLLRALNALNDSVALLGPSAITTVDWVAHATRQHVEIVQAIGRQDSAAAGEAMRKHVHDGFQRRVAATLKKGKTARVATPIASAFSRPAQKARPGKK